MSPADAPVSAAGSRVAAVVRRITAAAVTESAAAGIVVLADWTPEGELLYEWLVHELGEVRVWRAASLASNVHEGSPELALQLEHEGVVLTAHPVNKTALLLGGRPPRADLLPLGDVWASQIEALTGRWSGPAEVEALAAAAGGATALDTALRALVEERQPAQAVALPPASDAAGELLRLYARGRFFRRWPRLVPKLTVRTLGIDLFE
jgi:hypothetical protein